MDLQGQLISRQVQSNNGSGVPQDCALASLLNANQLEINQIKPALHSGLRLRVQYVSRRGHMHQNQNAAIHDAGSYPVIHSNNPHRKNVNWQNNMFVNCLSVMGPLCHINPRLHHPE